MSDWTIVTDSLTIRREKAVEALVEGRIIAVFFHNDRLFAIDGMCAHQGGPLAKGIVSSGCVTCPWHGWQYELDSGVQTVNRQPLQETFEVRENAGNVEVKLTGEVNL